MVQEIFVDASFWTALFYRPDEHHSEAEVIWQEIERNRWLTATTNWTLYETLTYLNSRGRHRHDLALEVFAVVSNSSEVVHIEGAVLEDLTLDIFRHHPDKRWSVVDCANFACIESRRCEFALAYDHNFEQAQVEFGFRLLKP